MDTDRAVEIRLQLDTYLPVQYISTESLRIGVYKRLAQARSMEGIEEIGEELRDRYGRLPEPVSNLLLTAHLRVLARSLGIKSIIQQQKHFRINGFYRLSVG